MIGLLDGEVVDIQGRIVTLLVGGVGYEVHGSNRCLERCVPRAATRIIVHTDVREDDIRLYGFGSREERQVFLLLTKVNGVGKKMALDTVSAVDTPSLFRAIGSGDIERLQKIPGIGKKRAERIIVELKDKVADFTTELVESSFGDGERVVLKKVEGIQGEAVEALVVLGFARKDAEVAAERALVGSRVTTSGDLVREALQYI